MGQPEMEEHKYTIEEWLDLEQSDGIRYEYHFGDVYAMAGSNSQCEHRCVVSLRGCCAVTPPMNT